MLKIKQNSINSICELLDKNNNPAQSGIIVLNFK